MKSEFDRMVDEAVQRKLKEKAEEAADRVVAQMIGPQVTGPAPGVDVAIPMPGRRRFTQAAPRGCWLALGQTSREPPMKGTQLDQALTIARQALAAGPAERSVLTRLVEGHFGRNRKNGDAGISSIVSRLIVLGFLVVVERPDKQGEGR